MNEQQFKALLYYIDVRHDLSDLRDTMSHKELLDKTEMLKDNALMCAGFDLEKPLSN